MMFFLRECSFSLGLNQNLSQDLSLGLRHDLSLGISLSHDCSLNLVVARFAESVNSGLISDSDIQRHARWNSFEMLYRYRCQTLESQLKASRLFLISRV